MFFPPFFPQRPSKIKKERKKENALAAVLCIPSSNVCGEDPRATGGLVSNLPHPQINKTKQPTSFIRLCVMRLPSSPFSIAGVPSSQALPGVLITAHHLCAFLMYLAHELCGGKTPHKKKRVTGGKYSAGPPDRDSFFRPTCLIGCSLPALSGD